MSVRVREGKQESPGASQGERAEKERAIEIAVKQIEKQFGKGSLMRMGEGVDIKIETIPTGSLLLDEALGIGGYPRGRIVEVFGPESSGKTTLALHAIAEAQKKGGFAAFIDAEHALDPVYARNLGVKVDDLFVSQPDTGEQALEIADSLIRSGALNIIVVDSVAALTPQAEIAGEMGDHQMGSQAKLMSQALRKLTGTLSKSGTCLLFINQIRMRIGITFGNPETTTGGNALKFYASVRLDVRKGETIGRSGEHALGHRIKVRVVKNKMAPPFRRAEMEVFFGKGISRCGGLLDAAISRGIVEKSGSWYSLGGERIGQGRDNAREYFENNGEKAKEVEERLRHLLFDQDHKAPESPRPPRQ